MRPLDRFCERWRVLAASMVWLCLALTGAPAMASQAMAQEARQSPGVMEAPMPSMPIASDCMPCAICCLAPTPTTQGFSGEIRQPEQPGWQLLMQPALEVKKRSTLEAAIHDCLCASCTAVGGIDQRDAVRSQA